MKNVLIVDDSKFIRTIVELEISCITEVNIVTAKSYKETKILMKKMDFHAAVLDVNLPDAENGEVIDLLLEKNVPSVVLTGQINDTVKNILLEKEIVEYVTKNDPNNISYIAIIIKRIINNYDNYVLVIDDSKSSRMLTKLNLEKFNINVIEAQSAEEAIEKLESQKHNISMVITDYEMADMDGIQLTIYLRQKYTKSQLAIIAISGSENSSVIKKFMRYGANDFIKKPYTNEEFDARINSNLELINYYEEIINNINNNCIK